MYIAILGTDGAGKTSVIEAIVPDLRAYTNGSVEVKHLRPGFLPPLARLRGQKVQQLGPVTDPHGSSPSGVVGSLARAIYLLTDYVLGYWFIVRPKIRKCSTIFIFDRYAYDMAIDPWRFRISLSPRVMWWFVRFAPKPDLIICLHAEPSHVASRKRELSIEETRRQIDALRKFAQSESRCVLIDTSASIENSKNQILREIHKHIDART